MNYSKFRLAAMFALVAAIAACTPSCASTPRQVVSATVVTAGSAVAALHREHQRVYTEATNALREAIHARGGTSADYDREVQSIDVEFNARSDVLVNIDAHLRSAASIIDASRANNSTSWREAVGPVLTALRITLESLQQGNVLDPVPIPPEVLQVLRTLSTLAGEQSPEMDAGHEQ